MKFGLFPVTVTSSNPTFYELLLPALVLGSLSVAYVARLMRTNLVENLRSDYVRTAISKGLTKRRPTACTRCATRSSPSSPSSGSTSGPSSAAPSSPRASSTSPAVGGYIFRAIRVRDGASVVGSVTFLVIVYLVVNLLVDLLYGLLDPRISHD